MVDGVISAGACGGLLSAAPLRGTALAFLVPISDSIVVLVMCVIMVRQPVKMFLGSLREVAGAAADPSQVERVRTHLAQFLENRPYALLVVVTKLGRSHFVLSYVKPNEPIDGSTADALRADLNREMGQVFTPVETEVIIARKPLFEK